MCDRYLTGLLPEGIVFGPAPTCLTALPTDRYRAIACEHQCAEERILVLWKVYCMARGESGGRVTNAEYEAHRVKSAYGDGKAQNAHSHITNPYYFCLYVGVGARCTGSLLPLDPEAGRSRRPAVAYGCLRGAMTACMLAYVIHIQMRRRTPL